MSRKTQSRATPVATPPSPQPPAAAPARPSRRTLFVASGAALLLAAGAGVYAYASRASSNARAALARRAELNREHAPGVGEPAAPVHIVEFIDPACETCAVFYPLVKRLLVEHKGRIRLSMRHVPFHQGADDVVRLLEASRSQDRYWTVLEALLVAQARWAPNHRARLELALPVVAATGLDLPRALAEMGAPEIAQRMRRDLDDATTLDVTKTPEYFVNGRQMASFGRQQLIALVDDELRRSS